MCEALRELMKDELIEAENKGRKAMEAENKALREEIVRLQAELAKRK